MNTLNLLEKKERKVQRLCNQCHALEDTKERAQIFKQMSDTMVEHNRIEQALLQSPGARSGLNAPTREAIEEHLTLRRIVVDLLDMINGEGGLDQAMDALKEQGNHPGVDARRSEAPRLEVPVSSEQCAVIGETLDRIFTRLHLQEPPDAAPAKPDEPGTLN